ncbi:DJ-1/PfpI family protein [Actinoplanes sp. KI2]|uniref:DJ-1/PfpI family protein n=1 Tax=Actinoplanes sp. KI2 TaxID=2983315 RepID=UPI0021D5B419|nr:DJ-1/PfpI family protein [Actinoplanes sp. KI2]MCU7724274.1 DJ-1/PfpI family protein [Actinoplanes sp. KI2]
MRRLVRILLSVVLGLAIPAAVLGAGFVVTMGRDFTVHNGSAESAEAASAAAREPAAPAGGSGRIPVAVLLGANGSVATDVLGPYDVLADSARFDVYTVSVHAEPVALSGGLTAVPDHTTDDVRNGRAPLPRIVVVPAFTDPAGTDEAPLRDLVERVHDTGGLVVSVCAGARVLAQTNVLDGRRATSFWSDLPGLRRSHPRTTWVAGVRWVQDGNVMTTAGVSSGIIGSLHLVQQFAGADEARRIGARLHYPGWDPSTTTAPAIPARQVSAADYPYALHATLPWFQPTYGLGLTEGVDEIDVAAVAELYGAVAFTAHVVPVAPQPIVTTAHGLRLLATPIGRAPALDRLVVPGVRETTLAAGGVPTWLPQAEARPGDSAFDPVLRDIAAADGRAVAATAAKYLEYPVPALPDRTGRPWRIIGLVAGLVVLAAAGAVVPLRVRRRRVQPGPGSESCAPPGSPSVSA